MAKRGPKPIQINWDEFDKLCGIQCTIEEIAGWYNCSVDTIENVVKRDKKQKFSEYFSKKRGVGKISLRRKQYQVAMDGNPTMLLWLGKQYLGQADKQELNASGISTIKIESNDKEL